MLVIWLKFIICAAAILCAGIMVTKYGKAIAEKTGISKAWTGLFLLAVLTSLPELANGISAVTVVNKPALAVGNIFGACIFNLLTVSLLDITQIFRRKETIFLYINEANIISAIAASFVLLLAGLGIAYSSRGMTFSFAGISIYTLLIALVYFLAQKLAYDYEKKNRDDKTNIKESLRSLFLKFAFFGAIVVAAGIWLPMIGAEIVEGTGMGDSFVSMFFLGFATTLPELVVSFTALFMGEVHMALGNLIGSNLFDVFLLFIDDLFYRGGSLLAGVPANLDMGALFGALGMGLLLIAMLSRQRWIIILLILNFIVAFASLYYFNVSVM